MKTGAIALALQGFMADETVQNSKIGFGGM